MAGPILQYVQRRYEDKKISDVIFITCSYYALWQVKEMYIVESICVKDPMKIENRRSVC